MPAKDEITNAREDKANFMLSFADNSENPVLYKLKLNIKSIVNNEGKSIINGPNDRTPSIRTNDTKIGK